MATLAELEAALINADRAGDTEAARILAQAIIAKRAEPPPRSLGEEAVRQVGLTARYGVEGLAQAAQLVTEPMRTAIVNPAARALGLPEAHPLTQAVSGVADRLGLPQPENATERVVGDAARLVAGAGGTAGAAGLAARGATGTTQTALRALADAPGMQAVSAAGGGAAQGAVRENGGGTAAQVAASIVGGVAAPMAAQAMPSVVQAARAPAQQVVQRVKEVAAGNARPTPGTQGSVGAAGTDVAAMRRQLASDLPVPIELTKGQATRDFGQQQFEREIAKKADLGAPIRERFADQNFKILQNFDAWVDQTGAQAPNLRATGRAVDRAVVTQAKRDKVEINVAYQKARAAGEMEQPVALDRLVQHLNDSEPDAATAPLLDVARRRALRLGVATEDANGQLVAQPVPLKIAETYRQAVSRATDFEPTNIRQSTIIKSLVDEQTDGLGGGLYKKARELRTAYARRYENRAIVSKLINTKRGTEDRQIALEDVFDFTILRGSNDDIRHLRGVLRTSGDDGRQAWRELQGSTVQWLKSEATKNIQRDQMGNEIVSPAALDKAIRSLDAEGKLELIFGKKQAQQLRDLNDLAKVVYTAPPGSVNTSNTASIILAALDMGVSGAAGLPLPITSGLKLLISKIKDQKLAARVRDALRQPTK